MTQAPFAELLALQDLDTAISQHVHRLAHLPEAAAVVELDAALASANQRRVAAAAARDEAAGRQAALESELATTEERSRAVSARLYGGEVSASRDLQALAADIETLKGRASDLEDRVLAVLEEREPLDAAVAAADGEIAGLAERREAAEEARSRAEAAVTGELEELRARRVEAAGGVPEPLLADYERIRARAGGVGAARLVSGRCEGCHLTLPAVELDRIKRATPDTVVHCEECGRILVRP